MKVTPEGKEGVTVKLGAHDEELLAHGGVFNLKKILVPIDFSSCSEKALTYALAFSRQFSASIVLLHVVHVNYSGIEFGLVDFPSLEQEVAEGARKSLMELSKRAISEDVQVEIVVKTGQAFRQITEAARELGADVIIMSTHGNTGLKHVLLGSTTENVVRHAHCPVLTVREQEHEFV